MNNVYYGKLIFELSKPGRVGYSLPKQEISGYSVDSLPEGLKRSEKTILPACDELTVVRHYTNMSNNNFGVDTGFYPLGSCTMKYNPKLNEELCRIAAEEGKSLRPRYSAGYGDFSLENQRGIFDLLSPAKHIGLTLKDNLIMVPEKSVTAVIGLY